jgi:capsular polysaccharide transport system ATP-binding protein
MIELRNLTKSYPVKNGLRYVLRDVSLTIPSRTNLAVLGPNGCGKSTFLRLIGGAEPADSGSIITDEEISWPLGLASGFQGSLTGRQNLLFACRINGLDSDQSRYVIGQVSEFANLGEYFDMPVNTYSSGMRARLGFGLSMSFKFDVYLIDELTSVGDMIFREKAKKAFEDIRKRASLVFVSHNLQTLRQSCQSALFLREGQADFFPDINEGIETYTEYIRSQRTANLPYQDPKLIEQRRAERVAAKEERRLAKVSLRLDKRAARNQPQPPSDDAPPSH